MSKLSDIKLNEKKNWLLYSRVQSGKTQAINTIINNAGENVTILYLSALAYNEIVKNAAQSLIEVSPIGAKVVVLNQCSTSSVVDQKSGRDSLVPKPQLAGLNEHPVTYVGKCDTNDLPRTLKCLAHFYKKFRKEHGSATFSIIIDEADILALNEDDPKSSKKARTETERMVRMLIKRATSVVYVTATPVGTIFNDGRYKVDDAVFLTPQYEDEFEYVDVFNNLIHVDVSIPVDSKGKYNPRSDKNFTNIISKNVNGKDPSLTLITNTTKTNDHNDIKDDLTRIFPKVPIIIHNGDAPKCYLGGAEVKPIGSKNFSSIRTAIGHFDISSYKDVVVISGYKASRSVNIACDKYRRRLTDQYLVVNDRMNRANLLQRCRIFGKYKKGYAPRLHCSLELWNDICDSIILNEQATINFILNKNTNVFQIEDESGSVRAPTNKPKSRGIERSVTDGSSVAKLANDNIAEVLNSPDHYHSTKRIPLKDYFNTLEALKKLQDEWLSFDDESHPNYLPKYSNLIQAKKGSITGRDKATEGTTFLDTTGQRTIKTELLELLTDPEFIKNHGLLGDFGVDLYDFDHFTFVNMAQVGETRQNKRQFDNNVMKSSTDIWRIALVSNPNDKDNMFIEIRSKWMTDLSRDLTKNPRQITPQDTRNLTSYSFYEKTTNDIVVNSFTEKVSLIVYKKK